MSTVDPTAYTVVTNEGRNESPSFQELRQALEKGSDQLKLDTLTQIIVSTLNGNPQPNLLMPIIQFVLPNRNKQIKKMLAFYWEICPKLDENGKLKQEMILVCNAIRNDLQHPNEYIRGGTLRAVQKLQEAELLEPLVPTVRSCMEHRHPYVRKNAVFTVYSIFKTHEHLIPDAPEILLTFLAAESDPTCRRNAFVSLCNIAQPRAVEYLLSIFDEISSLDELMQLAVIDLVRRDARSDSPHRAKWIRTIFELLTASSSTVKYEAATSLTTLTSNPAAVKAAAGTFLELCVKEADNNVKLIVLERVNALRIKHEFVLDSLVMDVMRVLNSAAGGGDMEVKRKALALALELVSGRNVGEVVAVLKKQLINTQEEKGDEKNLEYRQLLIQSIHSCAIRFSEVAASVVHVLMEFIGDAGNSSAVDVISFVREVVEKFPKLRQSIVAKLLETISDVKSGKVFRGALWIIGEYCAETEDIDSAFQAIRKIIGEVPILASEQRALDEIDGPDEPTGPVEHKPSTTTRVLADGTYATETVYSSSLLEKEKIAKIRAKAAAPLRSLILAGDFYTGSVLSSSIVKLVLRFHEKSSDIKAVNALRAEAMLIMASIIRVGQSKFVAVPIDEDSQERILNCIRTIAELAESRPANELFLADTKAAYAKMVKAAASKVEERKRKENKLVQIQVDDSISFRQFSKKATGGDADELETDLIRATGAADIKDDFISKLSKVIQLTGFSDPVYSEAVVTVHGFDINLDVLIVNQTQETLQNLSVEFATLGDLKVVERASTHTLAPHGFLSLKSTIKVSSTETGVIFGNIVYDGQSASEPSSNVVLSDIHIDIMEYIKPGTCTETQFRSMWTEFEWENFLRITTSITDLRVAMNRIASCTNMSTLTSDAYLSGDCNFIAANLYARSIFGEDALANLSLEKSDDGIVSGHVRIRSKTQGIALSLGEKITASMKVASP
ncbi:coatomer protein [Phaffia rhodozyma]|uniref:Coatomer subunit beta n=1 Tax=Phaffia rhodozyma TaxID=264483 RepID=A0A0F7SNR9_PHARH|nr:coatomer protein [Phaffia rhodozyma]